MNQPINRRTLLAAGIGAAVSAPGLVRANDEKTLKVGLVGCGGRGLGSVINCFQADPNLELVAIADAFPEALAKGLTILQKNKILNGRISPEIEKRAFAGLDSYQKVIDSGIDIILLASPPGYRPEHFSAAVEKGLHVFAEKPCATDLDGIQKFLKANEVAKKKGLSILGGFCYRYSESTQELFKRIQDGAIGDILSIDSRYYTGPIKAMQSPAARPADMSDYEWQLRNWYNIVWLGGDGIVEQACHNVDRIDWLLGSNQKTVAIANGGRLRPNFEGNIYDHFNITYEFENGTRATMGWRQFPNAHRDVSDRIVGSKGVATFVPSGGEIVGETSWRWRKPRTPKNMYVAEHEVFLKAIRSESPLETGESLAQSSALAILGREAAYTGLRLTMGDIMQAKQQLVPATHDMGAALDIRPMRIPGEASTQAITLAS